MSAESETVFSTKSIKDKILISGNENKSPVPTRSVNKNLFKEGALDQNNHDQFLTSSEKKKGRKALAEITNELKAKQQQRYNNEGPTSKPFFRSNEQSSSEKKREFQRKELHLFETFMNEKVDLKHNIEQKFGQMRSRVSLLQNNFDSSMSLGKKVEEKYYCILQLSKGTEFIKLSFKKGKLSKRFVFYSESLNALCWRDPKSKFPKTKQVLYLSEIKNICASYSQSKAKKPTNLKFDESCFLSIEAESRTFDLIANNTETKNLWVKTLNLLLLLNKGKFGENSSFIGQKDYESVAKQFVTEMGTVEDEIDQLKHLVRSNEKNIRKNLIEKAEGFIQKEAEYMYDMSKTIRTLEKELEDTTTAKRAAEIDSMCAKKHLESSQLQQNQLLSQMRNHNEEKESIIKVIREFQSKLLNCVEFINLLDFQVQDKQGEHMVTTMNMAGGYLNTDFSNLDLVMNQLQLSFDNIMMKSTNIQKQFFKLHETLKDHAKIQNESENAQKQQYQQIYTLYDEALKDKKKLSTELHTVSDQLNVNVRENLKLKKEISHLESQLNDMKNKTLAKESEIEGLLHTAKKLRGEMDVRCESITKQHRHNEMEKLNFLEERYNHQIRRYENKIVENEQIINEMNDLLKNYEGQVEEYVHEIDKKQSVIDDLTKSRARLDDMIREMENDLRAKQLLSANKSRSNYSLHQQQMFSPYAQHCTSSYFSDTHSPVEQAFRTLKTEEDVLNTEQKISKAVHERERVHKKQLEEMETSISMHRSEIQKLEKEKDLYSNKVHQHREVEDKLKQKITKYQESVKGLMEEGAKIKKHYKQLELHLSYWLNLIYLENLYMFMKEHPNTNAKFDDEFNQTVLAFGTKKVRSLFSDMIPKNDFLKTIITKVEETIPNITFDDKLLELARYYQAKQAKEYLLVKKQKQSTDSFVSTYDSDDRFHKRGSSYTGGDSVDRFDTTCHTLRRTNGSENREITPRDLREENPPIMTIQNIHPFVISGGLNSSGNNSYQSKQNGRSGSFGMDPSASKTVKVSLNDIIAKKVF